MTAPVLTITVPAAHTKRMLELLRIHGPQGTKALASRCGVALLSAQSILGRLRKSGNVRKSACPCCGSHVWAFVAMTRAPGRVAA